MQQPPVVSTVRWWPIIRSNFVGPVVCASAWVVVLALAQPEIQATAGWKVHGEYAFVAAVQVLILSGMSLFLLLVLDFPILVMVEFVVARLLGGKGAMHSLLRSLNRYQVPILADTGIFLIFMVREAFVLHVLSLPPTIASALAVAVRVSFFVVGALATMVLPFLALRASQRFSAIRAAVSAALAFGVFSIAGFPIAFVLAFEPIFFEILMWTFLRIYVPSLFPPYFVSAIFSLGCALA